MAVATYDEALRRLLVHEGGYTNHPDDPGGPTNFGITIADYRRYLKPGASASDVKAMRLDDAKTIYRAKYWTALRCDELPPGLDYAVFDYGVNSGAGRAAAVLLRTLGLPGASRFNDAAVAAAGRGDAATMIAGICDERLNFLKQLKTWPVFGVGWSRRVAEVRRAALAMAVSRAASRPSAPAPAKGVVPLNAGARAKTAGGLVVAGTVAAQQAHQSGARPVIVIAIIAIAVVLVVAGWTVWRWQQRRQQLAPIPGEQP